MTQEALQAADSQKLCGASPQIAEAWVVQNPTKPATSRNDFGRLEVQGYMPVMIPKRSGSLRLSFTRTSWTASASESLR